ncbi:MAG: hypothetical protein NTX76_03590 [Alphaproteobacteria bacterium]|nr:hypothetical protein [Alphaproteobacteria bacterium]
MAKLYCAWAKPGDAFDPAIHLREDIKIFSLSITQREGEVAIARILVCQKEAMADGGLWAFFSWQDDDGITLLFSGKRVGFPRGISKSVALKDLTEIEFSAEPIDAQQQLGVMAESLKVRPFYDDLFILGRDQNPVNVLEARTTLFCWDRASGRLGLSDIFQGARVRDLGSHILSDSLKISLGDVPLDSVSVELSAEWIQCGQGDVNIYPRIARAFPKGLVNTLTPKQMQNDWPKVGDKIGPALSRKQSGYQVVASSLRLMHPPSTGVLGIYPTVTPEVTVFDGREKKAVRLRRSWFRGELVLHWIYRQKRREVVHFVVRQNTQLSGKIKAAHKTLKIGLQAIDQDGKGDGNGDGKASFFITDRGRQAVEHAMEVARAHLAFSARCIEVEFQVPFDRVKDISLDESVSIVAPQIPGGRLVGKVIDYRLGMAADKMIGWIRLGVAPGVENSVKEAGNLLEVGCYAESDYSVDGDFCGVTPGGIVYEEYRNQQPTEGVLCPQNLTVHDIVEDVRVSGDAEEQTRFLVQNQYPVLDDARAEVFRQPTALDVRLKDLRTTDVAEHHIDVTVVGFWSAPQQIQLHHGTF